MRALLCSWSNCWRSLIIAVLAGVALPAGAFVCTRTPGLGPSVFWPRRTVFIRPHGGGFEVSQGKLIDTLKKSAASWSGLDCSDLAVELGEPTLKRVIGFDWHKGSGSPENENIVLFRNDTTGDELDRWVHSLGALAITTVTFDAHTGRLLDADVEINDVAFEFTTCDLEECEIVFDLENMLTHELGHVIGLDHPPNDEEGAFDATMFASASEGDIGKRDLAPDDVDGACTIYPRGTAQAGECYGVGRPNPLVVNFTQTACGATGMGSAHAFAVMLAMALWRRRRTRTYTPVRIETAAENRTPHS